MHDAFAQFAEQGQASGALLETAESMRAEILHGTQLAVALVDGQVVAVVKYEELPDRTLYFSRLAVATSARGRGLAGLLLRALRREAEQRGLRGSRAVCGRRRPTTSPSTGTWEWRSPAGSSAPV